MKPLLQTLERIVLGLVILFMIVALLGNIHAAYKRKGDVSDSRSLSELSL